MSNFKVKFIPSGRGKAQCAPDPQFPSGKPIDVSDGKEPNCTIRLPYPAAECGMFICSCRTCGFGLGVTAAGRPDDPITVKVACKPVPE